MTILKVLAIVFGAGLASVFVIVLISGFCRGGIVRLLDHKTKST